MTALLSAGRLRKQIGERTLFDIESLSIEAGQHYVLTGVNGAGKSTLMLPNESHGYRARESILHMLAETNDWLDEYVKNAKPEAVVPAAK